jgi:hypothetical protein
MEQGARGKTESREHDNSGVLKRLFFTSKPLKGEIYKLLDFNKSPLGDLGVFHKKMTFSTPPMGM